MDRPITLLSHCAGRLALIFSILYGWAAPALAEPAKGSPAEIRVGVFENRPIVFSDADGKPAGLAVDVLEEIARREQWRLVYTHRPWTELLDRLARGDLDLVVGIAHSAERARRFEFTRESLVDNWGIVYKARGLPIVGLLDLKERRVALMRNAIHTDAFVDLLARFNVPYTPVYVDAYADVLHAVATKQADAGVVNRIFSAVNAGGYAVDITGIVFNPVYIHYAARKGAPPETIGALDRHLRALKADPRSLYYESLNRWLADGPTQPLPEWMRWTFIGFAFVLSIALGGAWLLQGVVRRRTSELARRSGELDREVERRRVMQQQFDEIAFVDSLTGLPNRASFRERFPDIVSDAERSGTKIAVLFINIDRLKTVNDSLGHATGDVLIRTVAERLRSCLRANDSIYRFGGDEFIVAVGRIRTVADVQTVANRLLGSLKEPVDTGERVLYVSASMGVALYPDDDRTLDGLLKNADAAMYHAKERGRDRYQLYQRDLTDRVVERLDTQTRLHRALERNEFSICYQPIVELASGDVVGAEALLRWLDPERGQISPAVFIPHAEESGAIIPIGIWVLMQACAQAVAWQQRGFGSISIAVNVSSRQFEDIRWTATVERALKSSGLDPALLELEITEGVLLATHLQVRETLLTVRRLGVRVAIDDFGTGYSSLAYLKQFPIDVLKIDRSFVSGIPDKADDCQIATAIIGMAHGLGLTVVAEGIETEPQRRFLQAHGCGRGQGYHIARPMEAAQMQTWLADRGRLRSRGKRGPQERSA